MDSTDKELVGRYIDVAKQFLKGEANYDKLRTEWYTAYNAVKSTDGRWVLYAVCFYSFFALAPFGCYYILQRMNNYEPTKELTYLITNDFINSKS